LMLNRLLSSVLRTTPQKLTLLRSLNLETVEDLLLYYPFRYEDKSQMRPISLFNVQEINNSSGMLSAIKNERTNFGKNIQKSTFTDDQGMSIECVWFNQPYLSQQWGHPVKVMISGRVKFSNGKMSFQSPTIERWSDEQVHVGGIVPVYPFHH